jgi:predicted RNase H-like nuclease (RuvC/YqgF family)
MATSAYFEEECERLTKENEMQRQNFSKKYREMAKENEEQRQELTNQYREIQHLKERVKMLTNALAQKGVVLVDDNDDERCRLNKK